MDKISLNASMRSNLLSLQNISKAVSHTQNKLSTGLKVNSAIDNPSSYYTARSLSNRARDLTALLDSMGQAIQTIKAATTGLETGAELLAQASAVAAQALTQDIEHDNLQKKTTADFEAEGYSRVRSGVELQQLLNYGKTKLVLDADIFLDIGINIDQVGIKIEGNGHKIIFNGNTSAVFDINGNGEVDIRNLHIEAVGYKVCGIRVTNGGKLTIDNAQGFKLTGNGSQKIVNGNHEFYNGQTNTATILAEYRDATSAKLAYEYKAYEGDIGKWYLPSMGELMQLFNTDIDIAADNIKSSDGADIAYFENELEKAITNAGGTPLEGWYWSSSEYNANNSWRILINNGLRSYYYKNIVSSNIRSFQHFENCFNPVETPLNAAPKITNIMYQNTKNGEILWSDKDATSDVPENYVAIGVITDVTDTGDVTIIALHDANDDTMVEWSPEYKNISGVQEYDIMTLPSVLKSGGAVTVKNVPFTYGGGMLAKNCNEYNKIISQYNLQIQDSLYKGINIIGGDTLSVRFSEYCSAGLNINGKDMTAASMGINSFQWQNREDVISAINEITFGIIQIRSFQSELGNSYSIITNRQEFTESLINVLTEGADKLTLADMNEESANMLALQTRQQLAVNALSLASQASQGILKLF